MIIKHDQKICKHYISKFMRFLKDDLWSPFHNIIS
jgi:hypothetical protein